MAGMTLAQIADLDWWPYAVISALVAGFAVVGVLSGMIAHAKLRAARRRRRLNLCPSCGYCLIGNISGVCPECGTPAWKVG
jgi:hypothetical protein